MRTGVPPLCVEAAPFTGTLYLHSALPFWPPKVAEFLEILSNLGQSGFDFWTQNEGALAHDSKALNSADSFKPNFDAMKSIYIRCQYTCA